MARVAVFGLLVGSAVGFAPTWHGRHAVSVLRAGPSPEDLRRLLAEEAMNPATLAETAERMKSMKPGDIDSLLSEMASMSSDQKAQLKAMGMDPGMVSSTKTGSSLHIAKAKPKASVVCCNSFCCVITDGAVYENDARQP
jgi:hypothetical protein